MSRKPFVLNGVTKAIAETGELLTITRTTTVSDPDKPTLPGQTVVKSFDAMGYIYPKTFWDAGNSQVVSITMVIIDSTQCEFVTQPGDVITDGRGQSFKLLEAQHPRLEGDDMAYIHQVASV